MTFREVDTSDFSALFELQKAYKASIGEGVLNENEFDTLKEAMESGVIKFFVCEQMGSLIAMCSVCKTFSTFNYKPSGLFEDFYIVNEHRKKGIAKKLVQFAFEQSDVATLIVGCADCDIELYKALGFKNIIGNMLSYTK